MGFAKIFDNFARKRTFPQKKNSTVFFDFGENGNLIHLGSFLGDMRSYFMTKTRPDLSIKENKNVKVCVITICIVHYSPYYT